MSIRPAAGFASIVLALLFVPAAQAATVTLGQVAPPGSDNTCDECSGFQVGTAAGTPSLAVPPLAPAGKPWTLTSWSARGGLNIPGTLRLQIWRPTSTAGEVRLVAQTDYATFPVAAVTSVAASVPVEPGDLLGIRTGPSAVPANYDTSAAGDVLLSVVGDAAPGQTAGAPSSDFTSFTTPKERVNVAATLTSPDKPKCRKKHKKRAADAKKRKCKKKRKK